jgi:hypothetical protein
VEQRRESDGSVDGAGARRHLSVNPVRPSLFPDSTRLSMSKDRLEVKGVFDDGG